MIRVINILKRLPIDFNQREMGKRSKAKLIAFDFLAAHPAPCRILDLGCRDGLWSEELKRRGYTVISADIAPHYEEAVRMDADRPFPFPDGSFDVVWSSEVLEHLCFPERALAEVRRILKSNGAFVFTVPNSYFWLFLFFILAGWLFGQSAAITLRKTQNQDHKQFFSYRGLRILMPNALICGFFPYFGPLRFTVTQPWMIALLSPVFVIYARKE